MIGWEKSIDAFLSGLKGGGYSWKKNAKVDVVSNFRQTQMLAIAKEDAAIAAERGEHVMFAYRAVEMITLEDARAMAALATMAFLDWCNENKSDPKALLIKWRTDQNDVQSYLEYGQYALDTLRRLTRNNE